MKFDGARVARTLAVVAYGSAGVPGSWLGVVAG
jgi:hypothetical protein